MGAPAASLPFRVEADAILLHLRLTPKGGRDAFDGIASGADGKCVLQARVRAVPEDGLANAALISLLAKALGVRKSVVELVAGTASRQKTIRISGDPAVILPALERLCDL
ncbi:MAG: hypothetical protein FD175_2646 [Beijerinckiaceae bacterium]|nr:MAG: hypothetical protein FD175_2646 [Beijerinckiaceae bacterium]